MSSANIVIGFLRVTSYSYLYMLWAGVMNTMRAIK